MISTVKGDPTNACDVWGGWVSLHVLGCGCLDGSVLTLASLFPSVWGRDQTGGGGGISRVTQDTDTHRRFPRSKTGRIRLTVFPRLRLFPLSDVESDITVVR